MELVLAVYNAQPYFSLKNLGKNVHVIHSKKRHMHLNVGQRSGSRGIEQKGKRTRLLGGGRSMGTKW